MRNVVLVPCWRRAEFLAVSLELLQAADPSGRNFYIILVDRGHSPEVADVARRFPLPHLVRFAPRHRFHGNSYNILEGYRLALDKVGDRDKSIIYLVEEDVFVAKDFFRFHEVAWTTFNPFCVSAARNQNIPSERIPLNPSAADVYTHESYQSLGISWRARHLETVIRHALPDYYNNMSAYVRRHFPLSRLGFSCHEQDGLICRVMESMGLSTLYPMLPRAYHAGFVGYNRPGNRLIGTLQERIARLRGLSDTEMNALASKYKDITACNLEGYNTTHLCSVDTRALPSP